VTADTCPHCGCSKYNDEVYLCHTKVSDPSMSIGVRSIHCHQLYELKVKIAAKDAEIERLKEAVLDEREACVEICKRLSKGRGCFVNDVLHEAVTAIKARGVE
jgi:hypothetical protein